MTGYISDKRALVSSSKRKFNPSVADQSTVSDHRMSLGRSLKDVIPNACLFKGNFFPC